MTTPGPVDRLRQRGVEIHGPASVDIDAAVEPERIAPDVIIHAGCRIRGAGTSIGPGCVLGAEGPVTLDNCRLGRNVSLPGGSFTESVLLDDVAVGPMAQVRAGSLLEEQVRCGHAVGFKQTILMPFVTSGSLINFCDVLMAGGTDRRNHGEIGSGHVHFNFTPHQDKATASLLGDVPNGVMLDQPPVFLGGQSGLVGPVRIAYGTVVGAGTVCRQDVTTPGRLVVGCAGHRLRDTPYQPGLYGNITRKLATCILYIANLHALLAWYRHARRPILDQAPHGAACREGAVAVLQSVLAERIKRLDGLAANMPRSLALANEATPGADRQPPYALQKRFAAEWPAIQAQLADTNTQRGDPAARDRFRAAFTTNLQADYITTIKSLPPAVKQAGTTWLQTIVDEITNVAASVGERT